MKALLPVLIAAAALTAPIALAEDASGPKSVRLTVYNDNFALVKDTRTVALKNGLNSVEVVDVAARIDPTSILFKSLSDPNSVAILEQNYQYDLVSPDSILNKSIGEKVTFTWYDGAGNLRQDEGELLSGPANGGIVIRRADGTLVLRPTGQTNLRKMPEGLHPKPTLNWLLRSDKDGSQETEISYITEGIGWKCDYVALVDKDDANLDLTGWVTLDNKSGASYKDAKLTLMAGDVRRVRERGDLYQESRLAYAAKAAEPQFEEKSFFEYHMYTMERPTTVRDNETKQLALLNTSNVPAKKEMIYDARGDWFRSWWYPGRRDYDPGGGYDTSNYHKVNVVLEIKNSKDNHMGMPLPKGKMRVYKLDDTGSQQFIGEDTIDHTPRDEKIRLYIGDAFDVVGDYKRTNYKKIAERVLEESFEAVIRNHKKTAVEVKVVDHVWSDWSVTQSTHAHVKKDAHTIEFPVKVAADGQVKITYTIRTQW